MSCDSEIHDALKEMDQLVCDFCDVKLVDDIIVKQEDPCCEKMDLIQDNGMNVCKSCGVVNGYDLQPPYVDFYENMYKKRKKSVYIRKYHIINTIYDIAQDNNIQISNHDRDKILRIFASVNQVLSQVNGDRKRMISIKFILRQIYRIVGIKYKCIPLSKSKKTNLKTNGNKFTN